MRPLGAALCLLAMPAASQQVELGTPLNQYEMRYGEPVDVSLTDLVQSPDSYFDRAVRTHGRLVLESLRNYVLQDGFGSRVVIVPVSEIGAGWEAEARTLFGQDVEVTGAFLRTSVTDPTGTATAAGLIRFWAFIGGDAPKETLAKAEAFSLETLVTRPGRYDGRLVKVVGQFRGRNLFGDLPTRSQSGRSDWVLKDELFAVWITGRKPKGDGFELDPSLKRDTGKWLEVTGRVETRRGATCVVAQKVVLTTEPRPAAQAQPPPPPPERPRRSPVVVFALPLDGDLDVPGDTRFAVQFSNDMDENSFRGKVVLRYAGRPMPGDREFDGVRMNYDGGRRALIVDPGNRLRPGRQVELLLLQGIVDSDGQALETRPGHTPDAGVVDVLRYQVGFF
ncbi:MAG TPA: Ig-like domain-containing protein [Vicinamibacteria bacterium]|nr:Ig-like domain-containing protein [Vicinamibacteria bacterium]